MKNKLKLGSNPGDNVFFDDYYKNRFPKSQGFYGEITGCTPARNYNLMAKYNVDVFQNGEYVTTITCEWGDITDKDR